MSGCLWEYGDVSFSFFFLFPLRARGCSLKRWRRLRRRRERPQAGLLDPLGESESTSRWISCSTLNTRKNMVHKAPHLANRKEFESRLILWTVIFPRRHLHAPGITGLWGDYRRGKRGYKSKNFSSSPRAQERTDWRSHNSTSVPHVCALRACDWLSSLCKRRLW